MRLTPAGISVYKDAKFLLSFSKESIKRAKEIEKNEGNLVRVALSPLTPTKFLGQVWPIASKQYPDLRIQLVPFENEKKHRLEHALTLRIRWPSRHCRCDI